MHDPGVIFNLFLMLSMGHFVGDFAMQSDRMAVEKCPGCEVVLSWRWWLTAHAAIHGFLVAWLTGIPLLGLAEWGIHILIDLGKCRGFYRLTTDQGLHILCKSIWAVLAITLGPGSGWRAVV
ncbi:MAG: DUF3307 domain-containing protein [Synechococcus sp.]